MSPIITAPRGTKDVLPQHTQAWQSLEERLRQVARRYGFAEIRFPTFESTELFQRGVGDTTDVVQKEMYTFEDKGGRSITLRPEGTASVVRSYIENSLYAAGLPQKVYYIAPNFRYEKPQAGRLREHHQFGVESFGSSSPLADVEVMGVARALFDDLGLKNIELCLNSIGCPSCRPAFQGALKAYFSAHAAQLCPTCLDRLERNPLRILDCKVDSCASLRDGAPLISDSLCDDCRAHQNGVTGALDAVGMAYSFDPHIVRGLDYYTRTVFEFVTSDLGAQSTVCGGGRYDGLVESLGGPATPALGFGMGLERLLLIIEKQGAALEAQRPDLYLVSAGDDARIPVFALTHTLRAAGLSVDCDLLSRSVKAQMKAADRSNVRYSMVLGADELSRGQAALKDMTTGQAAEVALTSEGILSALAL